MNNYFLKKTQDIRDETRQTQIDPISRIQEQVGDKLLNKRPFELKPISRIKLRELLNKSKGGTACGHDNIDGRILRIAAPLLEDGLIHMINLSITTNEFDLHQVP